jgi:hypothetical protein
MRVLYDYDGDPDAEKLFLALRHDVAHGPAFCWCIKATSQVARFMADADLLKGCVHYPKGELPFFDLETIIDPSNFITLLHSTIEKAAIANGYRVEGSMPADFHAKIAAAIRSSITLEPKRKAILLQCIGEKL